MADEATAAVTDAAPAKTDTGTAPEKAKSAEARARVMGWKPKEDFKGPDDKWVDADEYVRRGEEELPIIKSRLRDMEKRDAENTRLMRELVAMQKKQVERAAEDAVTKLKAERRQAVADADADRVEAIEERIEKVKAEAKPTYVSEVDPGTQRWVEANPWFKSDHTLHVAAVKALDIINVDPETAGLTNEEKLKVVSKHVRTLYPSRFPASKKPTANSVEGGGAPAGKGGKRTYQDLPAEAQSLCDRFVNRKVMTREQYVQNYVWE